MRQWNRLQTAASNSLSLISAILTLHEGKLYQGIVSSAAKSVASCL